MKVLHVQNLQGIGGSENYLIRILPALKKAGVDVACAVVFNRERPGSRKEVEFFCDQLRSDGVEVHLLETTSYLSPSILRFLFRIWKQGFQILHSHLVYADFWAACMRILSLGRITSVSTIHGYQERYIQSHILKPESMPRRLYWWVARFNQALSSGTYACSDGLRNFYERAGFSAARDWSVIEHGFDFEEEGEVAAKLGEPQIAVVGRLIQRKGVHLAIEAFEQLLKSMPTARLVLVGRGEEEAKLKKMVAERGLEAHVTFTGFDPNPRGFMRASDLIWVPSYAEGLPLVIFEAFHCERPVVAFDTVGCRDLIHDGENGTLVPAFDTSAFASRSIDLLDNQEKATALARKGKADLLEHYSLERMVADTVLFYQRLIGENERL